MSDDFHIHPSARHELHEALRFFAGVSHDGELALNFEATFDRYVDAIMANPLAFNLRRPPTRRVNLTPRFGEYYIAYMIWREQVVILAIAHAKCRPYYWRTRISEARNLF